MTHLARKQFRKKVGDYYLGRTIGEGAYAKVKYGQHVQTEEPVAVKILNKKDLLKDEMADQIKQEIAITRNLNHPNVVDLKEVMASKDKIYMVMELLTGGELFDKIADEGPMKEDAARRVFQQLIDALDYCHKQGIYHRDLKPENVLLSIDGRVKLSDFGLGALPSQQETSDGLLRTTCGTPNYVAPEVLKRRGYYGAPADIWSLGVVLYVILVGRLPFDDRHLPRLFKKIMTAQFEMPHHLSKDAKDVLRKTICPDPNLRITIPQLREHPWVKKDYRPIFAAEPNGSLNPEDDIFAENVKLMHVPSTSSEDGGDNKQVNAFDLISSALDLSSLFEQRNDVVHRHTRFTSNQSPEEILLRIEAAVNVIGGRLEKRSSKRLKIFYTNPQGVSLAASAEVFDLIPGTCMVEVSRNVGDHFHFRNFYADLTAQVKDIMTPAPINVNLQNEVVAGEGSAVAAGSSY